MNCNRKVSIPVAEDKYVRQVETHKSEKPEASVLTVLSVACPTSHSQQAPRPELAFTPSASNGVLFPAHGSFLIPKYKNDWLQFENLLFK